MEKIKNFFKVYGIIILCLFMLPIIIWNFVYSITKEKPSNEDTIYTINNEWTYLKYHDSKYLLSLSVDDYIHVVAPTSAIDGLYLVDKCEEYNIDIIFVLAQGQKESHFGTQGLAKRTNSVWNVFAYDGYKFEKINKGGIYQNANLSIEPYLDLLNKDYLNNKTEYELLENFVNSNGQRYATYENYESELTKIYVQIKNTTQIDSLQQEMKKYKSFINTKKINNMNEFIELQESYLVNIDDISWINTSVENNGVFALYIVLKRPNANITITDNSKTKIKNIYNYIKSKLKVK